MCRAEVPQHVGSGRAVRCGGGRARLGLVAAGGLLVALMVGCSSASSGDSTASGTTPPEPIVTPSPFASAPGAQGTSPPADPLVPASGTASAPASVPDGVTPDGTASGPPAAPGTAASSGDPGSGAGAGASEGPATPSVPVPQPSPVFLGEACAPVTDTAPAMAVNGLMLYCVPPVGAAAALEAGRWSTEPPDSASQPRPEEGGTCSQADVGRVVPDAAGRPVSCLRDPTGALTWADVS